MIFKNIYKKKKKKTDFRKDTGNGFFKEGRKKSHLNIFCKLPLVNNFFFKMCVFPNLYKIFLAWDICLHLR